MSIRDEQRSHVGNHELQGHYWRKAAPDQWRTVSLPLSAFRKNIRGIEYTALPSMPTRVGDIVTLRSTPTVDQHTLRDRLPA